jgi:MFS transporter, VNT family, synaptic vesicle glycoprotein 2
LKILEKMYQINNCSVEKYSVDELIKDSDYKEAVSQLTARQECCFFDTFKLMWKQTAPLFNNEHLKNTFLACLVQFLIFLTSNGLYMFFPEILNRMAVYSDSQMTVCEILDATRINVQDIHVRNETELMKVCINKLELSTYEHTFILEALYAVGFAIIGVIINYTGKLPIILVVLFGCGLCAISLIFVKIPMLTTYLYVVLLACGLAINVVNASTIELYPTSLR